MEKDGEDESGFKIFYGDIMATSTTRAEGMQKSRHDDDGEPVKEETFLEEESWTIVDAFFNKHSISSQQIESFNDFVENGIPRILDGVPEIVIGDQNNKKHFFNISADGYELKKPTFTEGDTLESIIYPSQARLRNLSYSGELWVKVKQFTESEGKLKKEIVGKSKKKLMIGRIPIMVMSKICRLATLAPEEFSKLCECPMDPGGYFIIDGREKVIMTQERAANNTPFVFERFTHSKAILECEIRSTKEDSVASAKAFWVILYPQKLKIDERMGIFNKTQNVASKDVVIKVAFPGLSGPVPLHILFQAIGFHNPRIVYESIVELCARQSRAKEQESENIITPFLIPSLQAWETLTPEESKSEIGMLYTRRKYDRDINSNTSDEDFEELSKQERHRFMSKLLVHDFLPHVGVEVEVSCFKKKGLFLSYMVWKLLMVYTGQIPYDDRDHLQNKRYQCSGPLISQIFQQSLHSLREDAEKLLRIQIRNRGSKPDIGRALSSTFVTNHMKNCVANGHWGNKREMLMKNSRMYSNVTQELNRYTRNSHVSCLRRLNSPEDKLSLMTKPRQLHSTYWGVICPFESPEGEPIGLVKNMALLAQITVSAPVQVVMDFVKNKGGVIALESAVARKLYKTGLTKVFVDGRWVGFTEVPETFLKIFKEGRKSGEINPYISICWERSNKVIEIRADAGRLCRPLLVVKDNQLVLNSSHIYKLKKGELKWDDLIRLGVVEIIDVRESESALIAMDLSTTNSHENKIKTFTHMEIHPSLLVGICASTVLFANHTQSPRIVYQAGISKQAMGVYGTNLLHRMDTSSHFLHYGQRPVVQAKSMKYSAYQEHPAGNVCVVAIAAYTGYNMEDSIILNRSAVERGLFRATMFRTYQQKAEKFRNSEGEQLEYLFQYPDSGTTRGVKTVPGQTDVDRMRLYSNIDTDGLPRPGERLGYREMNHVKLRNITRTTRDYDPADQLAIVGKVRTLFQKEKDQISALLGRKDQEKLNMESPIIYHDSSVFERKPLFSHVDQTLITTNAAGERLVKVRIRKHLKPQVGDKFASLHGQKGVIGLDFHEVDLPFTNHGIVPDLIMNPHGLPSRMTIGQLYESSFGKAACLSGKIMDGTTFHTRKREVIERILKANGYYEDGTETMYDGRTGRKIYSRIFIGPTYYQRLKHLVDDKIHARGRGPVAPLTQQPVKGFSREGGLRLGEMERDCLIANGSFLFLMERLMDASDAKTFLICSKCGTMASQIPVWLDQVDKKTNKSKKIVGRTDYCTQCMDGDCDTITLPTMCTIRIPYAAKLFFQELMCMNIVPRIIPSEAKEALQPPMLYASKRPTITAALVETAFKAVATKKGVTATAESGDAPEDNLMEVGLIVDYDPKPYTEGEQAEAITYGNIV